MISIKQSRQGGFALLIAVLTVSVVLAVSISLLNITLKEFILSSTVRDSQAAFYAADAGMECALFWDSSKAAGEKGKFHPDSSNSTILCMGGNVEKIDEDAHTVHDEIGDNDFGETEEFQVGWGTAAEGYRCAHVRVTKYYDADDDVSIPADQGGDECLAGLTCTVIQSYGYSRACDDLLHPRTVERGLRSRY